MESSSGRPSGSELLVLTTALAANCACISLPLFFLPFQFKMRRRFFKRACKPLCEIGVTFPDHIYRQAGGGLQSTDSGPQRP